MFCLVLTYLDSPSVRAPPPTSLFPSLSLALLHCISKPPAHTCSWTHMCMPFVLVPPNWQLWWATRRWPRGCEPSGAATAFKASEILFKTQQTRHKFMSMCWMPHIRWCMPSRQTHVLFAGLTSSGHNEKVLGSNPRGSRLFSVQFSCSPSFLQHNNNVRLMNQRL